MKALVRRSASVLAISVWTAPVYAQNQAAPPTATSPDQNAEQGAAVTSTTPQESGGLQDIIVTAQRVEQSAQTAPIAISVVRPEDLVRQGVTRAEDLSRVVPALAASSAGGANTVFFIRGVGNFTQNAYSDAAVAFNYDGVYIGRPSSTSGTFYDLQRVEVLKGPQGTLYGRNATGGAINVVPNKPQVGVSALGFSGGYGNYDTFVAQAAGNVPIGSTGAFRLAGTYVRHDGYSNDGTGDQLEYGARAQVYADLTPDLNVRVSADYAHQGGDGTNSYYIGRTMPTFGPTGFAGYSFAPSGLGPKDGLLSDRSQAYLATFFSTQAGRAGQRILGDPYNSNDYWGVLAEVNWKTAAGTLTVAPAYREADLNNLFIQPGFNNAITDEHDQQASIEARWAGKVGDSIDYLIGGFYFKEDITANPSFSQFTLTPFQSLKTATESYAAFGKLTAHLGPRLRLTAAGRYTEDKKRFDGVSDIYILFCAIRRRRRISAPPCRSCRRCAPPASCAPSTPRAASRSRRRRCSCCRRRPADRRPRRSCSILGRRSIPGWPTTNLLTGSPRNTNSRRNPYSTPVSRPAIIPAASRLREAWKVIARRRSTRIPSAARTAF